MRPHRLLVTAFGAFGGTVEVCFDDLAASGLFLLHGETGAGKTTLLDAIGFALYGRVPGERGKARRLRSDHACSDMPTEVVLEATVGGRRLRITRKPEQTRPKRRGDGFTTEQARVLVEERSGDGSWVTLSTRAGEADMEIADLMGMSAEQFFQVVLLPQGEFAKFLHSDADDRRKLLQRLFGTDRFRAVEDWLAERRRTTAHEIAAAEQHIGQLMARVAEVAGVPMPTSSGAAEMPDTAAPGSTGGADCVGRVGGGYAGWVGWAAGLGEDALGEHTRAVSVVAARRESLDAALDAQREAERLADRQRRRTEALRKRDELTATEHRIAEARRDLDAARRAAEVAPSLAAVAQTARAFEQASAAEVRARADAGVRAGADAGVRAGADAGQMRLGEARTASAAELREAGEQRLLRAGQLEALRSLAEQATTEDEAAAAARSAAAELGAESESLTSRLAARRGRLDKLSADRDAARVAAANLPAVHADADQHRRAADDATALVKARAEADRHHVEHLAARETAVGFREEASRLREARIDGMRAELAATLADGAPCPVCGSLEHPELCELRGELVTREQEEEVTARAEHATVVAEAIGKKLTAAQTRVADLAARLDAAGFGGLAVMPLAAELRLEAARLDEVARSREAEASRLAAKAGKLADLETATEDFGRAIADAETRLVELDQRRTAELDKATAAGGRARLHRETLSGQLGGKPDLDSALAAVHAAARALTEAADSVDAAVRAAEAAGQAREAAATAAAQAGFPEVAAARAAQRDAAWRTRADTAIREHEAATASVADLLASPDLQVPLDPPADVVGTTEAATTARSAHDQAVEAKGQAQRKAGQLAALVPGLTARIEALKPLADRAAEVRGLADLAAGQGANTLRMTLSSFVLAARLEEVAAAASQRLLRMTAGRYSLVHTDSRRGGGRSGLGLLACDAWTGADRDTSTLSGGEIFMASLALALGLADVVTEEAGGTRIEALFVDEGFGSLDEETLEEVMNVLDGLREGGRCVGIVSHVSELRQRIPAQIRVRKGHSGSSLSVTTESLAS
jgi:exonuclease SbcC